MWRYRIPLLAGLLCTGCHPGPFWAIKHKDVTQGDVPPNAPVAVGRYARLVLISGDKSSFDLHVEPESVKMGKSGRARCVTNGAEQPWRPVEVHCTLNEIARHDAWVRNTQNCEDTIEIELSKVCADEQCETLRMRISREDLAALVPWPTLVK